MISDIAELSRGKTSLPQSCAPARQKIYRGPYTSLDSSIKYFRLRHTLYIFDSPKRDVCSRVAMAPPIWPQADYIRDANTHTLIERLASFD